MKKLLILSILFGFVISCQTSDVKRQHNHAMEHSHNHNDEEDHHHDHHHEHHNIDEFKGEVLNFHNKKGFEHSHILFIYSENKKEAFIRIDGHEYELDLDNTSNMLKYSSDEDGITFIIKSKEGILNIKGKKIEYNLLAKKDKNYAKTHNHDHK